MKSAEQQAGLIVEHIYSDFTDRRGLRHAWDEIDADIQEEILKYWREIVMEVLAS